MRYKYAGRGERLIREEDFAALGVEHSDVYFTADNDFVQELSDEAAQALMMHGESLVAEAGDPSPEDEPNDDDANMVDKELAEEEASKTRPSRKKT